VVGAPASGKRWLAGRIRALTGIGLVHLSAGQAEPPAELDERREWIALTSDVAATEAIAPRADLVVVLRTPLWLRDARLVMRRVKATLLRRAHPPLGPLIARSHRWDGETLPALQRRLASHAPMVASCASSDDVRRVLERVFGIAETG